MLRFVLINKGFEKLTKLSKNQIIGKTDHDISKKELADIYRENDLKVFENNSAETFTELTDFSTGEKQFVSYKFPIKDVEGSKETGIGVIAIEVTKLRNVSK